MTSREHIETKRCSSCGALNEITYHYGSFGPVNQERETGECAACRTTIARAQCLSILTKVVEGGAAAP